MYILAILYFVFATYLIGESINLLFLKKRIENTVIGNVIMKIGIGLTAFPLLIIILNPFKLINSFAILLIAAIVPVYFIIKSIFSKDSPKREKIRLKFKKEYIYIIIVIILFLIHLFVFTKGAFIYPYLENGDPLSHSLAAKYISDERTFSVPIEHQPLAHYLEPYPPFYSAFMSVFINLSGQDVVWVLKFMNALLISMSVLFIYYLIKRVTKSSAKGMIAAFLLLGINSFMGHFIYASSYATTLIFPGIYFTLELLENLKRENTKKLFSLRHIDWKLTLFLAIIYSGLFLVQPIISAVFGMFLAIIFLLVLFFKSLTGENRIFILKHLFLAVLIGLILTALFWGPAIQKYGFQSVSKTMGFQMFTDAQYKSADSPQGPIYSFNDFLTAPVANKIDQPHGIGTVPFLVFLATLAILLLKLKSILCSKNTAFKLFVLSTLFWMLFLIISLESNALPIKFFPYRMWAYFTIGLIFVTILGGSIILNSIKLKYIRIILIVLFIIGVIFTSSIPKYKIQTSMWPPGPEWTSGEELQGYLFMYQNIPWNTPVYAFCSNDMKVTSVNMRVVLIDDDLRNLKNNYALALSQNYSIRNTLREKGISHLIVDTECAKQFGVDIVNDILNKSISEGFIPVFSNNGFILLAIP